MCLHSFTGVVVSSMAVYFAKEDGGKAVKIGYTMGRVATRFSTVQSVAKRKLVLVGVVNGDRNEERQFHERFAEFAIGHEWFHIRGELEKYLETLPPPHPLLLPIIYDWKVDTSPPPPLKMGRAPKMTPKKITTAWALLKSGKSVAFTANRLKVSKPSIYNYFTIERSKKGRVTVKKKAK